MPASLHSDATGARSFTGVDFVILFFLAADAMSAPEPTFEQDNIELSCPAESAMRSTPTDSLAASDEPKMHPRGQLQRHVTLIPRYFFFSKYVSLSQLQAFRNFHKRAAYSLILLRH